MTTDHLTYELHQFDGQFWRKIYHNMDKATMIRRLNLELFEPTQKDRWKVVETETKQREIPLDSLGISV